MESHDSPAKLRLPVWRAVLSRTMRELVSDNIALVAAGVAFYGLLAVFPLLIAAVSLFGLVVEPAEVERSAAPLLTTLPGDARSLVEGQLHRIAASTEQSLGVGLVVSIVVALWTASSGVTNLNKALALAYDVAPRKLLRARLVALALTLGAIVVVGAMLLLVVVFPVVMARVGLPFGAELLAQLARWVVLALALLGGLAVLYRFGPSRERPHWRWLSAGSVVATALWLLVSLAFSTYVARFGSYNETYGALGGVIVLLLWLYIGAFAVLIGAELNAELEHEPAG